MAKSSTDRGGSKVLFEKFKLVKISTGSSNFDQLLGGGLPVSSITDVYGAAGTGKTQFAFQNAVMTCAKMKEVNAGVPSVVFVDCTGSFRPERIVDIAENRSLDSDEILRGISTISVRHVKKQVQVGEQIYSNALFSNCRLLIIDDVTSNFVIEYGEEEVASRQTALAMYMRSLSYLAQRKGISVLLTNSVRSRGDEGEGETTGEVLSQFSLHRMQLSRKDRIRFATSMQPNLSKPRIQFEVETSGIS
jgi:DNA repair protein RadA